MRNLLQDADRDRLVAPLTARLVGEVALGGRSFAALRAEEGSPLFPLAANAHATELLLQPGIREEHPALSDGLLDFVMAMAEIAPACRSAVAGGIELRREDPRDLDILTPFFRFTGDLSRGELRQAPRGPGGPRLLHGGNLVEFRIGRHRSCADVDEAIDGCAVERRGDRVVLRHAGPIRGAAGLLGPRQVEAGRLEVAYEIRPDSPLLRVTLRFTATRRLRGLRLTTALDALAEGGLGTGAARLLSGGTWRDAAPPGAPGTSRWAEGPVAHLALGAAGWPTCGPVLHLRPLAPERLASVTVEARRPGTVHWLLLRHGPADLAAGETLVVQEDRLLGPGGDIAAAARGMAAEASGLDLNPAPPSGAALNAAGAALLLDATGAWREALAPARRTALAGFASRQGEALADCEDIEELAWACLGADALRRTGDAAAPALHAQLLGRLGARIGPDAAVTARAVALLAFARAATWPEPKAAGNLPGLLSLDAAEAAEPGDLALLARAAGAVVLAAAHGAALPVETPDRARALHRAAVNRLRPTVRPRDGMLLVAPRGVLAAAPQALVTLALLAPDRLALQARLVEHVPA